MENSNLRRRRRELGYTLAQLADMVGVRDATIQRIQLVQTGPHTAMLVLTTSTGTVKSKLFRADYLQRAVSGYHGHVKGSLDLFQKTVKLAAHIPLMLGRDIN